jgi:hypothetical protein
VSAAPDAAAFLERLRGYGLRSVERLVLTRNRRVIVSVRGTELRVHHAFVGAAPSMQEAVARFVMARRRAERAAARSLLVKIDLPPSERRARLPERTHPDDLGLLRQVALWHAELNAEHFDGALGAVAIRVSRRMQRRLGHFAPGSDGRAGEIALSSRHLRRDGLAAARATLLHEMVHQWQQAQGLPLGHGAEFRRKCLSVGAPFRAPRASSPSRVRALP